MGNWLREHPSFVVWFCFASFVGAFPGAILWPYRCLTHEDPEFLVYVNAFLYPSVTLFSLVALAPWMVIAKRSKERGD